MCAVILDDGCSVLLNTAGLLGLCLNMVGDREDEYYVVDTPESKGLDRVGYEDEIRSNGITNDGSIYSRGGTWSCYWRSHHGTVNFGTTTVFASNRIPVLLHPE